MVSFTTNLPDPVDEELCVVPSNLPEVLLPPPPAAMADGTQQPQYLRRSN